MPAAHRLFFLPELFLPAISVSLRKSLTRPTFSAGRYDEWLSEQKWTECAGCGREPGWLARPHLRFVHLRFVLFATLVFEIVPNGSPARRWGLCYSNSSARSEE